MSIFVGNGTTGVEARANRLGLPTGTTDPATANAGDTYYKTDTNKIRVYNGTVWADLASGGTGTSGVEVERSLRFNRSDSAYLSRTPTVAGNRTTWTWAGWVKRSKIGNQRFSLFCAGNSGADETEFFFQQATGADSLVFYYYPGSYTGFCGTLMLFRDTSAWYHIVLALDTTQGTAANRCKIYVNGVQQSTNFTSNFGPSATPHINSTAPHQLGRSPTNAEPYDGYLADIHFIDGQALAPTAFTEVSATTGQLVPIVYTGTFGTNGFCLKFSDNSNNTAATLGNDYSSNNNDWTPNNLSVTAGAGNDSLVDTPNSYGTDTGAGGEVRGNYATLNNLLNTSGSYANGNLERTSSDNTGALGTICPSLGNWYAEFTWTTIGSAAGGVVVTNLLTSSGTNGVTQSWQLGYQSLGKLENAGSQSNVSSFVAGDVIAVSFNCSTGAATFYKNGVSVGTVTNAAFANVPVGIGGAHGGAVGTNTFVANFGQRPFAYTAPSGFKALCDTNLPAPVIAKPNTVMDVKLYQGNGSTQTISGLGFSPDLVWLKARSAADRNVVTDIVRGVTNTLNTDDGRSEASATEANQVTAYTSTGFTVGSNSNVNGSSVSFVAWAWDAGSSTVSNTQGSITSTVRANVSAGFSIVTWTTTSAIGTVGHGLNITPSIVLFKRRDSAQDWYFETNIIDGSYDYLVLNSTAAKVDGGSSWSTRATSTTITSFTGTAGVTYVAYCFAPVVGYSAMGSYISRSAPNFIYTGFTPALVICKRTDASGEGWLMTTWKTQGYNSFGAYLGAHSSAAEATASNYMDVVSNGFVHRHDSGWNNAPGGTYIYAAFAEHPFQYARAR